MSPIPPAQASESDFSKTITLEKTVQFEDAQGEEVLIDPGNYEVTAGKGTLHLSTPGSTTSITIEADETLHKADISMPVADSIPGQGPLADTHIVILFFPNGHALQAIGTYPGIQSRGIPEDIDLSGSPTTITFEKTVHFIAPDGSPVMATPGSYTAEAAEDWIRLIPGEERENALLIEAQKGTNDTKIDELIALSLPGSKENELDLHFVMLLLPTGHTLEATGSYSGIQPRGFSFKKTFNQAKRAAGSAYKGASGTVSQVGKGVGQAAQQVGKGVSQAALVAKNAAENSARVAAAKAEQVAKEVARFAASQGCKVLVGTIKAGNKILPFMLKPLEILKQGFSEVSQKLKTDSVFRNGIEKTTEAAFKQYKSVLPEVQRIADFFKNPKNKRSIDDLFSASNICSGSPGVMDQQLKQLGLVPNFASVQSAAPVQVKPQVLPQITVAMVPGVYRHEPMQNDWHMGSIVPDGDRLRWTNKAGASWGLTPDLANQRLLTGPDNPYYAQGLREFKLVISNGQITGFQFAGGTYTRETGQAPTQTAIRSRGVPLLCNHCFMSYEIGASIIVVGGIQPVFVYATNYEGQHRWYFSFGVGAGADVGLGGTIMIHPPVQKLDAFEGRSWGGAANYWAGGAVSLTDDFKFDGVGISLGVRGGGSLAHSWAWGL